MRNRLAKAVYGRSGKGRFGRLLAGLALFILICMAIRSDINTQEPSILHELGGEFANGLAQNIYAQFTPCAATGVGESYAEWMAYTQVETILPLYGMVRDEHITGGNSVGIREDDGHSRVLSYEELTNSGGSTSSVVKPETFLTESDLQALLREENQLVWQGSQAFVPHAQQQQVKLEDYKSYETLVKKFYTIDRNTMAGSDQLNLDDLLSRNMVLEKSSESPQILIYHTHSQETFADSVPGDVNTSIVGVGERLAQILREDYGYTVLHHLGQYDVDTRNDAYGKALPALEEILAQNPSIEVVIDLHRDEVAEGTKLAMDLDGRPTARFMFFNGMSRTPKTGNIDYLKNENIADNLAFSFQMQLKCEEYYPGLTRKIYLKGYRYNMHLRPRSLLVELGAQNNTVEEAMNACDPLAHVLNMVLSGE